MIKMNEEEIFKMKEFDEKQLSKLISDLRDINSYTSFKNGAYIYDLGKYQGSLLINYIEQLQNNWNELKNIIEQDIRQCEELIEMCPKELRNTIIGTRSYEEIIGCNKHILSKMQELEQGKDE